MTPYYRTATSNTTRGYWEKCKAKTLTGAKREATAAYSGNYMYETTLISVGDDVTEPRQILATKKLTASRWVEW